MPYNYEDYDSGADIRMTATGKDLRELFIDSAKGLTGIMVDLDNLKETRTIPVKVQAETLNDLYFEWLSEIIYIKDAESFLTGRIKLTEFDEQNLILHAELYGDTIDPRRQTLKVDVKAVTYYKFNIEKIDGQWVGEVVFDI